MAANSHRVKKMTKTIFKICSRSIENQIKRLLLLMCFIFSFMCTPPHAVAGDVQADSLAKYPDTPQGVVEAFVKADLKSPFGSNDARKTYTDSHRYNDEKYNWFSIVTSYKTTVLTQEANKAVIQVRFNLVGEVCTCEKLKLEVYYEDVNYQLEKINGLWKLVTSDLTPHISIKSAINILKQKQGLTQYQNPKTNNDFKVKRTIERNICLLNKIEADNSSSRQIPVDCGDLYERQRTTYPATPDAVVGAMLRADFDGASNEIIGDDDERMKYMAENIITPGSDSIAIITDYRIAKQTQQSTKATIEVLYKEIGNLNFDVPLKQLKRDSIVIYNLELKNGFWEITSPFKEPRISIRTAIKVLEHESREQYTKKSSNTDSTQRKKTIGKNLLLLKRMATTYQPNGAHK